MAEELRVDEWTDEQIAEHKAQFPESDAKRFAAVTDDEDVMGFFGSRGEADEFILALGRQALIAESFQEWARDATQRFVSDYDEVAKVVRGELIR